MNCKYCGALMNDDAKYCPQCGRKVQSNKNYFKSPVIWAICIIMIGSCAGIKYYIEKKSASISGYSETVKNGKGTEITGSNDTYTNMSNINNGGNVYLYDKTVYVISNNVLYSMKTDYSDTTKVQENVYGYFSRDNEYYYYSDQDYSYIQQNIKTGKQEVLFKNAYYVQNLGDKIYYQLDHKDGEEDESCENIYCYDVKTKKSTALNKDHSYNITVVDDMIYYTDNDQNLKAMTTEGKDTDFDTIKGVYNYVYHDGKLYYSLYNDDLGGGVLCYDLSTKKSASIDKEVQVYMMTFLGDQLVIGDYRNTSIYIYDDQKFKTLTDDYSGELEIAGDHIIYEIQANMLNTNNTFYAMDKDGNKQEITLTSLDDDAV